MKHTARPYLAFIVLVSLLFFASRSNIVAQSSSSFIEEFSSSTLDPAWQIVEFTGSRVYGYPLPANHISLTDNPGHLRYYVDPMTHADGFLNGFQPTYSYHSCCNHDPGLELHRTFSGENWTLDAKASYFLPFSNGRYFYLRIYFGDGGPNTFYVDFVRYRDGPWPAGTPETQPIQIHLAQKTGPNLEDVSILETVLPTHSLSSTYFYRLQRTGGMLTALWSTDGSNWNTAFSRDMGTQLDGLEQRVVIAGLSWFNPAGSYADYDYIKVASQNMAPTADPSGPYAALEGDEIVFNGTGSSDPDGDDLDYNWDFGDGTTGNGPTVAHVYADNRNYTVTLTVTDPEGLSDTQSTTAEIANVPPTVNAGANQTVFRNQVVTVSGTWMDPAGASDNPYSWVWDLTGGIPASDSGTALFGETIVRTTSFALEGFYTLNFTVSDKDGDSGSDSLIVEVLNQPPDCSNAIPSLDILWPPEHQFEPIEVLGVTDPEGDPIAVTINSIFQDEPVDTEGDGSFAPDGQGVGTATAEIRAERAGTKKVDGNGRVYHIGFTAEDGHGGICSGGVVVGVPKNQGENGTLIDDGPLFDSTVP